MPKKKNQTPKTAYTPISGQPRINHEPNTGKQVRSRENPGLTDYQTPAWQFHRCDEDHSLWGWGKLTDEEHLNIIKLLHGFEKTTWTQIKQAAGGRSSGTNNHPLPIEGFNKDALKRLEQLKLDDADELFSLRLNNTLRLYGIRDGRVLRFIWHDPYHGSAQGAYPTRK
jgi:hypothetical protein